MNSMKTVSVVITACDRLDLLERTLRSFLAYNTYPIEKFIIRDDSGLHDVMMKTSELMDSFFPQQVRHYFIGSLGQVGQAKSIDLLMAEVSTPYVFHLEDDWEFDRSGFIEDCFKVMDENVIQVRVRHRDDGSAAQTKPYNDIADQCTNHLFSLNPHLRRTDSVGFFEDLNETTLGDWVEGTSLKTLWLKEGACRHIGGHKTTNRPGTPYHSGVKKA